LILIINYLVPISLNKWNYNWTTNQTWSISQTIRKL